MTEKFTRRMRFTPITSTVVAILILAAGVTARQEGSQQNDPVEQLESDLRFQFENAFRHDTHERDQRLAQLNQSLSAWQQSLQTQEDQKLLIEWLTLSATRSLPGSVAQLPEVPGFSASNAIDPLLTEQLESLGESTPARGALQPAIPTVTGPAAVTPTPELSSESEISLDQPATVEPKKATVQLVSGGEAPPVPEVADVAGEQFEEPLLEKAEQASPAEPKELVTVNLTELAARIAGYHDGLDEVEVALVGVDNASLEFLTTQVKNLETLVEDFRFVQLYYDSLTPTERQSVLAPRSLQASITEVERHLLEFEERLEEDFLSSVDDRTAESITQLRQKIATISGQLEI